MLIPCPHVAVSYGFLWGSVVLACCCDENVFERVFFTPVYIPSASLLKDLRSLSASLGHVFSGGYKSGFATNELRQG